MEPVIRLFDAVAWAMIREMKERGMKITEIDEDLSYLSPHIYLRNIEEARSHNRKAHEDLTIHKTGTCE